MKTRIFTDANNQMRIVREEVVSLILTIIPCEADAIRIAKRWYTETAMNAV
ncbi:hypothetical protein [Pseudomonas sp. IzPS59]|uniref:hypothetical protein n=1 Tax=Pseudomonas sp. IzPS59 TaxID=2774459 RepID=UPI0039A12499